jgi:hypothetical protein
MGDLLPVHAFIIGAVDDLVINVREVSDKINFVTKILEITKHCVEDDGSTGVTDMAIVVNGDTAYVHANLFFLKGNNGSLLRVRVLNNLGSCS